MKKILVVLVLTLVLFECGRADLASYPKNTVWELASENNEVIGEIIFNKDGSVTFRKYPLHESYWTRDYCSWQEQESMVTWNCIDGSKFEGKRSARGCTMQQITGTFTSNNFSGERTFTALPSREETFALMDPK